ncbi:MAG: hypothetical protein KGY69_19440 [Bacteroidales bacterium]|nr:hypothetical protein [Bacteroidales bacterium]
MTTLKALQLVHFIRQKTSQERNRGNLRMERKNEGTQERGGDEEVMSNEL